jgi:hypothetical protein
MQSAYRPGKAGELVKSGAASKTSVAEITSVAVLSAAGQSVDNKIA